MRSATILLGNGQYITVREFNGGGSAESNLFALDAGVRIQDGTPEGIHNAAIDGILSIVLAHHVAGIDVSAPAYKEGVMTAVESIANEYD